MLNPYHPMDVSLVEKLCILAIQIYLSVPTIAWRAPISSLFNDPNRTFSRSLAIWAYTSILHCKSHLSSTHPTRHPLIASISTTVFVHPLPSSYFWPWTRCQRELLSTVATTSTDEPTSPRSTKTNTSFSYRSTGSSMLTLIRPDQEMPYLGSHLFAPSRPEYADAICTYFLSSLICICICTL